MDLPVPTVPSDFVGEWGWYAGERDSLAPARALLLCFGEPVTPDAPQVAGMQVWQMENVVGAVLDRLSRHRPGSEDVGVHEVLDLLFGADLLIALRKPEFQVVLDGLFQPAEACLVAHTRRILQELDVDDAGKTNLIQGLEGIGVVPHVPEAFRDARVFENRLDGLAVCGRRGEGQFRKTQHVDESHHSLRGGRGW